MATALLPDSTADRMDPVLAALESLVEGPGRVDGSTRAQGSRRPHRHPPVSRLRARRGGHRTR